MLATSIIESDLFYRLTPSSQALYVHLIMNADDDGFVDMWKGILRCLSVRQKALDDLINLGYVIIFDDDLLLISDWLVHNKIRLDRYASGRYKNRLDTLEIHQNGRYIKACGDFLSPQDK